MEEVRRRDLAQPSVAFGKLRVPFGPGKRSQRFSWSDKLGPTGVFHRLWRDESARARAALCESPSLIEVRPVVEPRGRRFRLLDFSARVFQIPFAPTSVSAGARGWHPAVEIPPIRESVSRTSGATRPLADALIAISRGWSTADPTPATSRQRVDGKLTTRQTQTSTHPLNNREEKRRSGGSPVRASYLPAPTSPRSAREIGMPPRIADSWANRPEQV